MMSNDSQSIIKVFPHLALFMASFISQKCCVDINFTTYDFLLTLFS